MAELYDSPPTGLPRYCSDWSTAYSHLGLLCTEESKRPFGIHLSVNLLVYLVLVA